MKHAPIDVLRRFAIAACSLLAAGALFHAEVASALVTRGDDALRAGDQTRAIGYYRRALVVDPRSAMSADRLAFNLLLRHTVVDAREAIVLASTALVIHPDDVPLLVDRALGEQRISRFAQAESDFIRAGRLGHDARYYYFAGRLAMKRGMRAQSRRYFSSAVALDPHFAPARTALERMHRSS